jgi:flagellar motor switch protein FliG
VIGNAHSGLTGARKAAIFVSLLGDEPAAAVLRELSQGDLQKITDEVASMKSVPLEVSVAVLEEFHQKMTDQEFIAMGGKDVSTRLLVKAFGESGAKSMIQRLAEDGEQQDLKVESLQKVDPQQLARFLVGEHSQTKALILRHLDTKQASALLMKLEPEVRADCVRRLANLGPSTPEAASKVSNVLNRRLKGMGTQSRQRDTGFKNVADILNSLSPSAASEILGNIEQVEPNLATTIRDTMFTFEDLVAVQDQELRELMNSIDKKTLMIALKGASRELRNHFYRTMSSRAVEMMKEDSEMMGPVRNKDVARAHSEIVAIARKLEAEGKIVLKSQGEDEYVV